MFRKLVFAGIYVAVLSTAAFAQTAEYGTAEEARAMLEKAVAAVKAGKAKALDMFNKGEGGFRDRDLYVFCANAFDGIETAHPTHRGVKYGRQRREWLCRWPGDDEDSNGGKDQRNRLYVAPAEF